MVLQRDRPVAIWGVSRPGAHISISLSNGRRGTTIADAVGSWRAILPAMHAGGPFTMTVAGAAGSIVLRDVMVGEVWVLSGQSNMTFPLSRSSTATEALSTANQPAIRLFTVARNSSLEPLIQVDGQWSECTPESARDFSAVGYYFGVELSRRLHVPIGLIHSSWPGSSAEEWIGAQELASNPDFYPILDRWKNAPELYKEASTSGQPFSLEFSDFSLKDSNGRSHPLRSLTEGNSPDAFDGEWTYSWKDAPDTRYEMDREGDRETTRWSGRLRHQDTASLTFVRAGGRSMDLSSLRTLSFRVRGQGLFVARLLQPTVTDDADYSSEPIEANSNWQTLDLPLEQFKQPDWGFKTPQMLQSITGIQFVSLIGKDEYDMRPPSGLFNGMIAPLVPYTVRGAVWYQGEGNAPRAQQYRKLLPALIRSWCAAWKEPDMQFLLVQLPNHGPAVPDPQESAWAELREAQLMATKLPGTALAVTIDLGEPANVHPPDKIDVGRRLALAAAGSVYGQRTAWSGPVYDSAVAEGATMRVRFRNVFAGLRTSDGKALRGFAMAGADRHFVWAQTRIDGNTLIVSSPAVTHPEAVRYDWADSPDGNLTNDSGVPASPFRTDAWPGLTDGKR